MVPSGSLSQLIMVPMSDPSIQSSDEFKNLVNDKKFQELLEDPAITEEVEKKNFAKLIANPKFIELSQDQEFLKKVMALYPKLIQHSQATANQAPITNSIPSP